MSCRRSAFKPRRWSWKSACATVLVELGLQEMATYRLTSPEREARRLPAGSPPDDQPYVRLANPIASDRVVLRHSLLAGLLEVVERNARLRERLTLFEIGPVYLLSEERRCLTSSCAWLSS